MAEPVVLLALNGSKDGPHALPIASRLAELAKAHIQTLDLSEAAGAPAEAILAAADQADTRLIVLCVPAADAALGAAAEAVIHAAACPVLLLDPARATADWALKRMLAAHDGSPSVSEALAPAAELAREAGAEFVVLHMADAERALETGSIAPPQYMDQVQHGWPAWSDEFLQRLGCVCPLADAPTRLLLGQGELAEEASRAAQAETADLIVLTWDGRGGAPQASMLTAMLQGAPCPIMVARVSAR